MGRSGGRARLADLPLLGMLMKRYLVTGATSGLGKAVAYSLLADGHLITTIGRRDANFSEPSDVARAVRASITIPGATHQGEPFDGIVHCAGAEVIHALRVATATSYNIGMTAAHSAFGVLMAAAQRGTVVDGGSIVLMSSVAAHRGTPGMAAYSAGKAAIEAMARCAALELAPRRIRVNCVAAGAFRSPMHDRLTSRMPAAAQDAYAELHPLSIGPVEAVRDAVLHLLGDASAWTTGSTVVVDGGFLAR